MRFSIPIRICLASSLVIGCAADTLAQVATEVSTAIVQAPVTAQAVRKFSFILFWNQDSANAQQMAETLRQAVAKLPDRLEWSAVNVTDPANRETVERYQVSRAPLPLVLCVAPNGAVTGAFVRQLNDVAVERALVTPAMADATKALQEQKVVIVHVKPAANSPLPNGAVVFMSDPAFKARTVVVDVVIGDPAESRFVTDLKIKPIDVVDSMLVVMAPPAVLVGTFPAQVTGQQLGTALHEAGKCCNDPNCKHNLRAQ